MNYREPLSQKVVAISISESDDLAVLGLANEHLRDAMTEISRHLLAMGARLVYGGDLRDNGYTRLLFELVARHRRDANIGDSRPAFSNYLPWPVHSIKSRAYLSGLRENLEGIGELRCLDRDGRDLAENDLVQLAPDAFTDLDWAESLTAMRRIQTEAIDARIVLGGEGDKLQRCHAWHRRRDRVRATSTSATLSAGRLRGDAQQTLPRTWGFCPELASLRPGQGVRAFHVGGRVTSQMACLRKRPRHWHGPFM